jgi:integrase
MARINFTSQRISAYQCEDGKGQSFLWDTVSPCLALRATANGSKAYTFQTNLHSKTLRITIGKPPEWTISLARAKANEWKVLVDQGIDPREVAAATKAKSTATALEKNSRKLLAREAWDAYMKAPHPKWGATHRQDHITASQEGGTVPKIGKRLTRPAPLASLLALPLHEITAGAVADWFKKESATRATFAKNCLRKFRAFINWCLTQPAYKTSAHADCCTATVVTDNVPRNRTKANDCLQREQLALWFKHVGKISNPVFSAYLQGLLLTGARRTELRLLKWSDINFEWPQMTIRDKVKGVRTIPLTPYFSSLIQSLPRENAFVFSSPSSKAGCIISANKPHDIAVAKAGLPRLSLHGLRRSFTTLSGWLDIPEGVAAQIQGHAPSGVREESYQRRPLDMLRMHHIRFESWILEQAGIAPA